jgi:hypothetical protein
MVTLPGRTAALAGSARRLESVGYLGMIMGALSLLTVPSRVSSSQEPVRLEQQRTAPGRSSVLRGDDVPMNHVISVFATMLKTISEEDPEYFSEYLSALDLVDAKDDVLWFAKEKAFIYQQQHPLSGGSFSRPDPVAHEALMLQVNRERAYALGVAFGELLRRLSERGYDEERVQVVQRLVEDRVRPGVTLGGAQFLSAAELAAREAAFFRGVDEGRK